jgi:S1-C subfamily serine protease
MTVDNACLLSTVHVGSPAEKAGLVPDDTLLRFGDSKVTDFKALTALISELNVGDTVEVEVERQVEDAAGDVRKKNVVTKVTFGPWPVEVAVRNAPPQ